MPLTAGTRLGPYEITSSLGAALDSREWRSMTLAPGTRLGAYEITGSLGAGGMGEVYKARDKRLDRAVAIKVLPQHAHGDPERRQRFDREARVVSSFVASSPRAVFDDHFESTQSGGHTCYDVSPDGKTFLMVTTPTTAQGAITHLNVVFNR
jgi:serine/threonine protein kinase